MISTIIADEHPLLREGIKSVLQDEIDMPLTNQAEDGRQLLRILEENLPDLLILDMDMPGESGIASLKKMLGLYPPLSILILSIHLTKRFAVRALTRTRRDPFVSAIWLNKDLDKAKCKWRRKGTFVP